MPKRHEISAEEVEEIKKAYKKNKDKNIDKRLEVLLIHAEGKKRAEISIRTGYSKQRITELVSEYRREGLEYFAQKHYKGNHRNMSYEEEATLLESFMERARVGQIVAIKEILVAYENKLGQPVKSNSQIYNVLARHEWRKIMPRSKHPDKASDEVIEASKKKRDCPRAL
jgi:transposase